MDAFDPRTEIDTRPNPLRIQELVDHCIGFLRDSPSDLKACAVVSRSWTSASQSHIFGQLSIRHTPLNNGWPRILEILRLSPHLILHIRRLELFSEGFSLEAFVAICEFPFTHIHHLLIHHPNCTVPGGLAIQQLLSLPSLTHVKIFADFLNPSCFLEMWVRGSPTIRHLDLFCYSSSPGFVRPIPDRRSTPIALDSLRIQLGDYISDWITHDLCPLDLSRLRFLSIICARQPVLQSATFAAALRTLEVLDLMLKASADVLDLSTLPSLVLIRMTIVGPYGDDPTGIEFQKSLDTLSTIPSDTRLRRILIWKSFLDRKACEKLDATLASLPVQPLPTLEFDMSSIGGNLRTIDNPAQFFPEMAAQNLLYFYNDNRFSDWFENLVGF
ncbi:hypothetical protein FB451DRAFT_1396222 [Mycena latifolia]|nr:hypothetical protein FB451DRAFT_1396222 [Mycena latifolia]